VVEMTFQGTELDGAGNPLTETVELFYRNPVDCVEELIGNPVFRDATSYAPKLKIAKGKGPACDTSGDDDEMEEAERLFDEMCTAEWWHQIQVRDYPPALQDVSYNVCSKYYLKAQQLLRSSSQRTRLSCLHSAEINKLGQST
jgi:hypothetical protein